MGKRKGERMNGRYFFTSESTTEGHPDKMADIISDSILDAIIKEDPWARVACETFCSTGLAIVAGQITTAAYVPIPDIVRQAIREIGYTDPRVGFHWETCGVLVSIDRQSPDIAMGVDRKGAGDQGIMFGYATDETPEYMPTPILYAHKLAMRAAEVRKNGTLPYLRPDGKTQVTVEYLDDKPVRIDAIVISLQHSPDVTLKKIEEDVIEHIVKPVIPPEFLDKNTRYYVNPTGRFVVGGPVADTGLTGRKTIVDTYGGFAHNGGGCFSGKDPTKVDRSASYMARYAAKNIVAAGLAKRCEIQVAYAIGVVEPISIYVDTFGTGIMPDEELTRIVKEVFDFTPWGMIEHLELLRPIYAKTACYGHFGRNLPEFTWEKIDKVDELKARIR